MSATLCAILLAAAAATDPPNDPGVSLETPQLYWDPSWGDISATDFVLTGVGAALFVTNLIVGPRQAKDRGGWLFDEDVRRGLRADTELKRLAARDASDVLLTITTSYPFVVDALGVAAWRRKSPDVAMRLAMIDLEVLVVTAAVQSTFNVLVSRERPYGRTCGGELPSDTRMCNSNRRYYSFFSGHTSQAFAAAAVTCSHHMNLPLHGGGGTELIPCFAGLGLATTTGLLRVVGDQHYATDVLIGAATGTIIGFGLPWLLYYRNGKSPPQPSSSDSTVQWRVVPTPTGVQAVGVF